MLLEISDATNQEKAELIDWFRALEDNEELAKNLQQREASWEQNQDYYQERYLYSDRI
jgi:hypothetical protein